MRGHTGGVSTIATLPNGNLATGSWDCTVKIWDPNTGTYLYTVSQGIPGDPNYVQTLLALPNDNLTSAAVEIKIWAT